MADKIKKKKGVQLTRNTDFKSGRSQWRENADRPKWRSWCVNILEWLRVKCVLVPPSVETHQNPRNVIFIPVYKMKPKVSLSPPSSRNIDLRMSRLAGLDLVREPSDRSQAEA